MSYGIRGGDGTADHVVDYNGVGGTDDNSSVSFSNAGQADQLTIDDVETLNVSVDGLQNSLETLSGTELSTLNQV